MKLNEALEVLREAAGDPHTNMTELMSAIVDILSTAKKTVIKIQSYENN